MVMENGKWRILFLALIGLNEPHNHRRNPPSHLDRIDTGSLATTSFCSARGRGHGVRALRVLRARAKTRHET